MKKYYPYLITVSHMINDSCQSVLPALLPLFIYTYGLSLEQAGFLILANTALSSLLQPLLGYISDKPIIEHLGLSPLVFYYRLVVQA